MRLAHKKLVGRDVKSKRCAYVDIAKGIAILSVVLLHVGYAYQECRLLNISGMLGWYWHVPVFFCLAGFFIKEEKLLQPWTFIKGKFKSLYLLALYIYLPATLLHNVLIKIGWYSTDVVYSGKAMSVWGVMDYVMGIVKTLLCAGQEPIMGAMWFVYALLFALCGLSIIYWLVKKCKLEDGSMFVILLALQIVSCIATNIFNFTIPRVSNAVSVMLLIYLGQQLNNRWKVQFNNVALLLVSILVVYESSLLIGGVGMNHNIFKDALQLTVGATCALYVICYFSKKMEKSFVGNVIEMVGRNSFYIMGLHFVGFRICAMLLNSMGLFEGELACLTTPPIGGGI